MNSCLIFTVSSFTALLLVNTKYWLEGMPDDSYKCFLPKVYAPFIRSGGFHGQSAPSRTGIFENTSLIVISNDFYITLLGILMMLDMLLFLFLWELSTLLKLQINVCILDVHFSIMDCE